MIQTEQDLLNSYEDRVKDARRFLQYSQNREANLRQVADMRQRALELTASADRLESETLNAEDNYRKACAEVAATRTKLATVKNENKLAKINSMADELAQLDPAALAEMIKRLEALQEAQR